MRDKSRFLERWETLKPYKSWLKEVEGSTNDFHCIPCRQTNTLSNMGVEALKSHMKSTRHRESTGITETTPSILSYFKPQSTAATSSKPSHPQNEDLVSQNVPSTSSHGTTITNNPPVSKSTNSPRTCSSLVCSEEN
ncbi:hypothetical protein QAD02_003438 [Eretmocerus hayati]|uniref:Uncharacterized protein n=1 Tax=Eretmocerus hayati TaxID=131215 RepID=A0ACC2NM62_9HYME|nr:hypothetical protein QAD02_003438 [Eretmocerus hayati]